VEFHFGTSAHRDLLTALGHGMFKFLDFAMDGYYLFDIYCFCTTHLGRLLRVINLRIDLSLYYVMVKLIGDGTSMPFRSDNNDLNLYE
jgi:hypothetical protein